MQDTVIDRLAHAWNVFRNKEPTQSLGPSVSSYHGYAGYAAYTSEKSIVSTIYNRIALDVASLDFKHIILDDNFEYLDDRPDSKLNELFNLEANIDQTGRAFIQDIIFTLCVQGQVALVPLETNLDPESTTGIEIYSARVGRIVQYHPKHVRVEVFDEDRAIYREVVVDKKHTPIIENPLYEVMNTPNSTLKRLVEKLRLLDVVDNRTNSGKLDMIIQLPYQTKTTTKQQLALDRKKRLEAQMEGSKYGIGYIDSTEKVIQLNRSVDNDLVPQVEYLRKELFNELGMTAGIFDGSASDDEMSNYWNRAIDPFASAITTEVRRKWLTKTARTQKQSFEWFRNILKFIPISQVAEIGDKLTRNEIASSNDMRRLLGWKPSKTERSKELINKNLKTEDVKPEVKTEPTTKKEEIK